MVWSEGRSLSTMPQGLASLILGVILLTQCHGVSWAVGVLLVVLAVAFFLTETGVMWDSERRRIRSYTGWKVEGLTCYWGGWKDVPLRTEWGLMRTRESLMNWRGAAGAIGIDSTELGFEMLDEKGENRATAVHDFTDKILAQRCLTELRSHANR